jgi:hypothetical protein
MSAPPPFYVSSFGSCFDLPCSALSGDALSRRVRCEESDIERSSIGERCETEQPTSDESIEYQARYESLV